MSAGLTTREQEELAELWELRGKITLAGRHYDKRKCEPLHCASSALVHAAAELFGAVHSSKCGAPVVLRLLL